LTCDEKYLYSFGNIQEKDKTRRIILGIPLGVMIVGWRPSWF